MPFNPYKQLLALLPDPPLQVGDVIAIEDGVATINMPGDITATARGDVPVGQRVFFRDGVIEGPAPDLDLEIIDLT